MCVRACVARVACVRVARRAMRVRRGRRARRELALGETSQALSTLREHARTYPRSALAEERDYLTFRAGSRGAAPDGVARAAARFLAVHPSGIYSSQVRAMQDASR